MRIVYEGERCEAGVLPAIADRREVAALEDVAIDRLKDASGWVVADAAAMLKQHGSARAESALWQALERWHNRWKDHASGLEKRRQSGDGIPWEEAIEEDLTEALMGGTGTTFGWRDERVFGRDDVWLPGEAEGLFEETRSFLESRGMNLKRGY
jgi:hypothetical protein